MTETTPSTRRDLLKTALRGGLLAALAATGYILTAPRTAPADKPDPACLDGGACSRCGIFSHCRKPAAQALRNADADASSNP